MLKKLISLSILYFAVVAGVLAEYENYPPDMKRILERGELVVAMTQKDMPPFYFVDKDQQMAGVDVELAKKMAKELGVKLRFNRTAKTFNGVVEKVFHREADIAISKLSRTLTRAKKVRFSKPYVVFRQGLLINRLKLAREISDVNEVTVTRFLKNCKRKVGVIKSSSFAEYAKKLFPKAKVEEYSTWEPEIINAVLAGDVLLAYRDEMEIKKVIRGYADAALKLKTVVLKDKTDEIAMAINWKDTHFLAWVNIFLENQHLELTAERILDKYPDIFEKNKK